MRFLEITSGGNPSIDLVRFIARNYYKAEKRKNVKILEVGCGTGANIWYLDREGFSATGLDGSMILKPGGLFFLQTFKDGCTGDGTGRKLSGEKNTFLEMSGEVLRSNSGIIRLISKEEIFDLYKNFTIDTIEELLRTAEGNGKYKIKEWIVICSKPCLEDSP
jgi:hypothetical protein